MSKPSAKIDLTFHGIKEAGMALFAWNPTVYDGFGDTLTFYLIESRTFQKQRLFDDLSSLLADEGLTSYRLYHVFGEASILLRVWVTKGREEDVAREIEVKVPQVRNVDVHVVWDMPHHWKWGPIDFKSMTLEKLTPAFVTEVQHAFNDPSSSMLASAIDDGLLRQVNQHPENILFFTFIKTHEKSLPRNNLVPLLEATKALLKKKCEQIHHTAVFFLKGGQTRLLIKGETTDVFHVGEFVAELNDTLAISNCVTQTSIVASKPILGREEIGQRSFEQIEHRDVAVAQALPELYDAVGLDEDLKGVLVHWTKREIVPRDWKKTEDVRDRLNQLRQALIQVIESNENGFASALNAIFRVVERPLRELQGAFIAKNIPNVPVNKVMAEALNHMPDGETKKLSHLTLGDRIQVYVHVLKSTGLSQEESLLSGWGPIIELRNEIAHNTKDLLPEWEDHMTTIMGFLDRYARLMNVIRENS